MRHAYSEDPAAHGGLHAGGDRAEGCHILFHLGNLMGFHGRRRQHRYCRCPSYTIVVAADSTAEIRAQTMAL